MAANFFQHTVNSSNVFFIVFPQKRNGLFPHRYKSSCWIDTLFTRTLITPDCSFKRAVVSSKKWMAYSLTVVNFTQDRSCSILTTLQKFHFWVCEINFYFAQQNISLQRTFLTYTSLCNQRTFVINWKVPLCVNWIANESASKKENKWKCFRTERGVFKKGNNAKRSKLYFRSVTDATQMYDEIGMLSAELKFK